ncbi:MAG: tail fiber domain-containing protein [bacterium]|nr:tail fiber domain-containing protein [bacterium]
MQRNYFLFAVLANALALMLAVSANAATPPKLSHQGYLLGAGDAPINGVVSLTFGIYDVATGGAAIWSETHPNVTVTEGLFTVALGTVVPISADVLSPPSSLPGSPLVRYLEIAVNGSPIVPRTELVASPYALTSSRLSGDLETKTGGLTATNVPDELSVTLDASDLESQLSLSQSGVKRFGIGIQQPSNPLGMRMVVGDLDRDGLLDVVVADAGSSMTLVDSTGSGGAVISSSVSSGLGLQPLGGGLTINAENSAGESRSTVHCSPDSAVHTLSQSSANVINNMRTRIDELEARLTMETSQNGDSRSNANIAATMNGNVVIGCASFTDGSGIPDNESEMVTDDTSSSFAARGSNGKYYVLGMTHKLSGGSSSVGVVADLDADGHADRSIWQKVDNSMTSSAVSVDVDDDGVPDVGTENYALVPRSVLKSYFQTGDKPTKSQFRAVSDSSGTGATVEVDTDKDNDPDGGSAMDAKESRATLKTYFENGDIPTQDNVVQTTTDSDGAGVSMRAPTALLTWGTGLAFRVDATGPSIRMDQDSVPTFAVTSTASSTEARLNKAIADGDTKLEMSAGQSECRLQLGDVNSDGFAEITTSSPSSLSGLPQTSSFRMGRPAVNTALISTDAFSSSMTLAHASTGPGDKPTSVQFGNLIDSYIHVEDDGITRISASSSTGVQLRDQFGNLRASMSTEGTGYFEQMIGIGMTPSHHIDVVGGAYCDGANWVNASDKNSKENFEQVNGEEILEKISDLEITKWNYKGDDDAQHIGPTAQDFKKTFGVGADDKSISTIDPSGIALAAIKELYSQLQAKDKEMKELREEMAKLKKEIEKKK